MQKELDIHSHVLKKVKENFKKKRKRWIISVNSTDTIENAYESAKNLLTFLTDSFTDDEKEKYSFQRVKVEVYPKNDEGLYLTQISYY